MKLVSLFSKEKNGTAKRCPFCGEELKPGKIYRSKTNEKCCETCYLKVNSPDKETPVPEQHNQVQASVSEQHAQAQTSRKEPVQQSGTVKDTLFRTFYFSDLRLPGTEQEAPAPMAEDDTALVKQIADRFFIGSRQVLLNPSGNEEQDRYQAMEWLIQFLSSVTNYSGDRFSDCYDRMVSSLKYEPNTLKLLLSQYESPCYDGGAGGYDITTTWMALKRLETVPTDIFLQAGSGKTREQEPSIQDLYRGVLPGEDFECVLKYRFSTGSEKQLIDYDKGIFLFNPFGLEGVYCFRIYSETW